MTTPTTPPAIERRLELSAPCEHVWKALTDPVEIAAWFGDSAGWDLRPGGLGWFGWKRHGRFSIRVEVVEPPHRLSWRWMHQPDVRFDESASTLVEWVLSPGPRGGTTLELRESGFKTEHHRKENEGGWTAELGELEAFLTPRAS